MEYIYQGTVYQSATDVYEAAQGELYALPAVAYPETTSPEEGSDHD